ncbi:C3a anaphylatoxin chemotactic receptor-like [Bufo gargarizans]|uniref:C3a anaphylatoxin chemotactic receptor-like n=1 Tax=Bufo gargarizans TaxID=30331 RepID=UPI001CF12FC7|nr:C3a anaphylatoxin chemotactic receptor-like [Bufo gargarizans]
MELSNDTIRNMTADYGNLSFSDLWDSISNLKVLDDTVDPTYISYTILEHIPTMCIIWYSITLILGVIGNALVIWIAGSRTRTVNAVWFLNLAIADFITCVSLPLRISEWALYLDITFDHFL